MHALSAPLSRVCAYKSAYERVDGRFGGWASCLSIKQSELRCAASTRGQGASGVPPATPGSDAGGPVDRLSLERVGSARGGGAVLAATVLGLRPDISAEAPLLHSGCAV